VRVNTVGSEAGTTVDTPAGEKTQVDRPIARDLLTGLWTRASLHEKLEDMLRHGHAPALLALDLDRFQTVNDSTGIATGDAVLLRVAKRILGAAPPGTIVARISGDEFAVVVPNGASGERVAARLLDLLGRPYAVNGFAVTLSVSIGLAVAPVHGTDADTLLRSANIALHHAEREGKNRWRRFEPLMQERATLRQSLESDLRLALALNKLELRRTMGVEQFEVHYQPQIALESGRLTGFEALVRWRHPTRGLVPPGEFIPLTEEIGLIGLLGAWVIATACRAAMAWPAPTDGPALHVAVNVSPLQLQERRALVGCIAGALAESGLPASRLEIEITESALIGDALGTLQAVKALGVRLSLDDFGTGYSSLSQLAQYPFDRLKIDRSFVHDLTMTVDPEDAGTGARRMAMARWMIQAVASLGGGLGLTTVAEGVETEEQAEIVRQAAVTDMQGFLVSKAIPAEGLQQWMADFAMNPWRPRTPIR